MTRKIIWEWISNPGLECLYLKEKDNTVIATGITVAELNGIIFKLNYKVVCDAKWLFQKADLDLESGQDKRQLSIQRKENGEWMVNKQSRVDLNGCAFIDIMASPFTNTLPIRNLNMKTNQPEIIKVAYIRISDLEVSFVEQKYTRLDPAEPPTRFLYQNVSNDFKAELTVDKDGIVVDYPNLWRQIIL